MANNRSNSTPIIFGSLLFFILQIVEANLIRTLQQNINLLQFGVPTFILTLESSLLGIISGILLLLLLPVKNLGVEPKNGSSEKWWLTAVSLAIIPLLIILYRLLLVSSGPSASLIQFWGQYKFVIFDWTMYSQVPSLWLGITMGWILKASLKQK